MAEINKSVFTFLENLNQNNNKDWFQANKKQYEEAKSNFIEFVDAVIAELAKKDPTIKGIEAKSCIFRINRDIRFAKDKSPYKTNFGASINKDGKKAFSAGYYIHLEPGQCFLGGGIYMPPADVLAKIRQEIDYSGTEFKKIILNKHFTASYSELDSFDKLANPPKGYAKDHQDIEILKLKSFVATRKASNAELCAKNSAKKIADDLAVLMPLFNFLNKAID